MVRVSVHDGPSLGPWWSESGSMMVRVWVHDGPAGDGRGLGQW